MTDDRPRRSSFRLPKGWGALGSGQGCVGSTSVVTLTTIVIMAWATFAGQAVARQEGGVGAVWLAGTSCEAQVREVLVGWGATQETYGDVGEFLGGHRWRLATDRIGVWVAVDVDRRGDPTLSRVDPRGTEHVTFGAACLSRRWSSPTSAPPAGAFDDAALASLVDAESAGVIYIWSPHMPLSVDGYRQVEQACSMLGIPLTPLLDPAADTEYARVVVAAAGLPETALRPVHSVELVFRNATLHAPSLLVYRGGHVIGQAVPGYRDTSGYRIVIESRLAVGDGALVAPLPGDR